MSSLLTAGPINKTVTVGKRHIIIYHMVKEGLINIVFIDASPKMHKTVVIFA